MNSKSVGFIGGGRITRIFLEGWKRSNALPASIVVSDCKTEVLSKLKASYPSIQIEEKIGAVIAQDIVFLAVHPPVMVEALSNVKASLKSDTMLVSLAPKFTASKIKDLLGGFGRIARVIPNAPSIIGAGYNPLFFAPGVTDNDKTALTALLAPLGDCPEVAEEKLEAYAVLSAMGPTYLWFQLQAMREVAGGFGLSEEDISRAMKRMVCGSARTLLESGLSPAEVLDLIPVKPLADMEPQVIEMFRTRLPAIYQKIKP